MRLAVLCLCLVILAGCVSQGEYDEAIKKLETADAALARSEQLRLQAMRDAAESKACWDALLEYLDEDEARIKRSLFERSGE